MLGEVLQNMNHRPIEVEALIQEEVILSDLIQMMIGKIVLHMV